MHLPCAHVTTVAHSKITRRFEHALQKIHYVDLVEGQLDATCSFLSVLTLPKTVAYALVLVRLTMPSKYCAAFELDAHNFLPGATTMTVGGR